MPEKPLIVNAHDLSHVERVITFARNFRKANPSIHDMQFSVYDRDGHYVVGTVFWDHDQDDFRINLTHYGDT
jgi:hypothetical protein